MSDEIIPDEIIPDEKDWTWVLEATCPECRFDVQGWPREQMGSRIRENAARWVEVLDGDDAVLRQRPRPDQWQRTGYRSDGAAFTVESFARYLLHDPVHHLADLG